MKTLKIVLGLSALTSPALAGIPFARGEIDFTAVATATYDSNVFGRRDATEDFYGTLAPRVLFARRAGQIDAEASAGISFIRYADQTQLKADNVDAVAMLRTNAAEARNFSGSVSAAYRESSDASSDINARIKAKAATFSGQGALVTGPRTDVALNVDYTDTERDVASDQQLLATVFRFGYKDFLVGNNLHLIGNYDETRSSGRNLRGAGLNQKSYSVAAGLSRAFYHDLIRAQVSYGYRVLNRSRSETSTGVTRQSGPVFTASIDGPFLPPRYFPKIKSKFELSYQESSTPGVNDTGNKTLAGLLSLGWQARPNTVVRFSAIRSQRLSVDDLTVVSSSLLLGLEQTIRYNLTGSVSAGYNWDTFRGVNRSDETILFNAGLNYLFARTWTATASYRLSSATSTLRQANYDRHLVSLSLAHRF
ncbi:MAG: outer membrane beta-barrel protein [Undibacterium sp.]|nr:outer membrane beta-barrel protein [Opitutaceae bacterium]